MPDELKQEYDRVYRLKNREKRLAQGREYYLNNLENKSAYSKQYYQLHREELIVKSRKYRSDNHDLVLARSRKCNKALNIKEKMLVLAHYGGNKLACLKCGFPDIRALSIDHINGGGKEHIKLIHGGKLGGHFYHWLIRQSYPEGYQTLCMNCQWIKRAENNEG